MISIAPYRKTAASLIGSVLTWVGVAYIPDGHIVRAEWYALAVALAGVTGVYSVTNAVKARKPAQDSGETPPQPAPVVEPMPVEPVPVASTVATVRRSRAVVRPETPNA